MVIFRNELPGIIRVKAAFGPFIMAIDGRCASGKTTLAAELQSVLCCNVVHMDDFYLPFSQRTEEIMAKPGGNIDYRKLINEVLRPLMSGNNVSYHPYDAHADKLLPSVQLDPSGVTILEGSYSFHPVLRFACQMSIFLDVLPDKQLERLRQRNLERIEAFRKVWIPREEEYLKVFQVKEKCDFLISEN